MKTPIYSPQAIRRTEDTVESSESNLSPNALPLSFETPMAISTKYYDSSTTDENKATEEAELTDLNHLKPGERLRYLREQRGFSLNHIADRLYLNPSVIKAIETDDYDSLPSAIFVRGYMRNYAKLLEVAPEPFIEAYNKIDQKPVPAIIPVKRERGQTGENAANNASTSDSWFKIVTFILAIILVILIALWGISPDLNLARLTESTPATNATQPTDNTANSSTPPVITTQPLTLKPMSETTNATSFTPPAEGENDPAQPAATTQPPTAATTPTPPPVQADPRQITVGFGTMSGWISVTDGANKNLFKGIIKTGETQKLEGTPPFKVLLGKNEKAIVEYNGQKFDKLETYPQREGKTLTFGSRQQE